MDNYFIVYLAGIKPPRNTAVKAREAAKKYNFEYKHELGFSLQEEAHMPMKFIKILNQIFSSININPIEYPIFSLSTCTDNQDNYFGIVYSQGNKMVDLYSNIFFFCFNIPNLLTNNKESDNSINYFNLQRN